MSDEIEVDDPETAVHEAEIVDPVRSAGALDKLLTRSQAARKLGLSVSTIRRMEGSELKPIIGRDGVHYFQEAELLEVFVRVRRVRAPDDERVDGALAARAFELFRDGADVVAVVKALREVPEKIEQLFGQWQKLRGFVILDAASVQTLAKHLDVLSFASETALLSAVDASIQRLVTRCVLCELEPAHLCRRCAEQAGLEAEHERRARKLYPRGPT